MAGWQRLNKPGDSWRWRMSHLVWGAFTIFMMGWAFLLGLLVGQGSLGTPEQVASLKGLTSAVPGLHNLSPAEEPASPPAPVEERLQQPQLTFYDDVERQAQGKAATPAPAKPATPAAPGAVAAPVAPAAPAAPATPAGQAVASLALAHQAAATAATPGAAPAPPAPGAPPLPSVRTGPPILGKPEPFRPETAPPVTLAPPVARPAAPAPPAHAQSGQPQPYQGATSPRPTAPGPGPVASAQAARPPQATAPAPVQRRGRLIVQVATFQEEGGARDLVNRLRAAGHPAFLLRSELEGVGPRYRVRVGPYEDIDLAQGAAGRIRIQHSLPAFVTREDQP